MRLLKWVDQEFKSFSSATMNLQQFEIFLLLGLASKWVLGNRGIRAGQD